MNLDAIERGEDREVFKETMAKLGIETPRSGIVHSVEAAVELVDKEIGYPVVVRPAYTMGGAGGGFCYNVEELRTICARGLDASLTHQCLIEESILNWEELEVEVVRDSKNQMIAVCFIENIDAVGVHTGDSYCAAPFLTIDKELEKRLQRDAFKIVEAIGVIGGTNVQFAHDPKTGRVVIIEINPRTSRSSALASKATGFPIALVSAKLAAGMTLDEIPYWRDGTLEKYTPSGDYIVLKFARWAFEKFRAVEDHLGTQMKAVGEVMSIGKTYKETLQKAIRALEKGRAGLGFAKDFHEKSLDELLKMLAIPNSERHFQMYEALRKGATDEQIFNLTGVKAYFVDQMRELVEEEEKILSYKGTLPPDDLLVQAKKDGFSDKYLSQLLKVPEKDIREKRTALGCVETWHAVPVSGVENQAYYYSSYNGKPGEVPVSDNKKKVLILGGGPNRIGQGIEFDYCCTHAAMAMREAGYETIMINCNPETVSTDYDTSDKLYFEPVTLEDRAADLPGGEARGHHRAVRRPDAAQHRGRAGGGRVQHPRHVREVHRRRRGPRPLPLHHGPPRHPDAGEPHGERPRRRAQGRGRDRLPDRDPPVVRAGRTRHGGDLRRDHAPRVHREGRGRDAGPSALPRPLPPPRARVRGGRALGRHGRVHPGDHGARGARGRPLGRLRLRAAAGLDQRGEQGDDPRLHAPHRERAEGRGPHEHAVRDRGRQGVRDRGEPARVAHRPARLEGGGHADGAHRDAPHARREREVARPRQEEDHPVPRREGGRAAVRGRACRSRSSRVGCSSRSARSRRTRRWPPRTSPTSASRSSARRGRSSSCGRRAFPPRWSRRSGRGVRTSSTSSRTAR